MLHCIIMRCNVFPMQRLESKTTKGYQNGPVSIARFHFIAAPGNAMRRDGPDK
jgi:hypothetical protein